MICESNWQSSCFKTWAVFSGRVAPVETRMVSFGARGEVGTSPAAMEPIILKGPGCEFGGMAKPSIMERWVEG